MLPRELTLPIPTSNGSVLVCYANAFNFEETRSPSRSYLESFKFFSLSQYISQNLKLFFNVAIFQKTFFRESINKIVPCD